MRNISTLYNRNILPENYRYHTSQAMENCFEKHKKRLTVFHKPACFSIIIPLKNHGKNSRKKKLIYSIVLFKEPLVKII